MRAMSPKFYYVSLYERFRVAPHSETSPTNDPQSDIEHSKVKATYICY